MSPTAVVLAAGLGTRMKSPLAKVLHPLLGRPMVGWVVEALRGAGLGGAGTTGVGIGDIVIVLHHQEATVRDACPGLRYARQEAPRGTGDALAAALSQLPRSGPVLVSAGDTPLVTAATVQRLLSAHRGRVTVASFEVADPTGYGRIVRAGGLRIVEEANASDVERRIHEVNSGMYVFEAAYLHERLPTLLPHPPKGEYYLTDLVDDEATVVGGFDAGEFLGVNDRAALAEARGILRRRVNRAWALAGVDFADLDNAEVDARVRLHPDARVGIGVVLQGACDIAGDIGAYCVLTDTKVGPGSKVLPGSVCEGAVIGAGCAVGPMARLRPGTVLEDGVRIGNFVEVKATRMGPGAKANHLTYLGDATVGAGANVGAGTITCNYDGVRKHPTVIGEGAFIGSNVALVAPVTIGAGAIIGAGSTVTEDVPADAIAVERSELRVRVSSAERLRIRYRTEAALLRRDGGDRG